MVNAPRIIFWETTKQCNLRCNYCRMHKTNAPSELTTAEALGIMREIQETFGAPLLILSGGEPLLRKDIFKLVSYASWIGLPIALATNGVLLGQKEASLLKKWNTKRVSISIDSVNSTKHDLSRGLKGSFERAKAACLALQKERVDFQINYTVTKHNKNEISSVSEFAVSIGASAVHYFILVPVGCGKEVEKRSMLDAIDNENVLNEIKALGRAAPIEIRTTCAPQYIRFTEGAYGGCLAGTGVFFISSEGEIYPCGYLPIKAGSLRESSVSDIWENAEIFNSLRRNNLKGSCAGCDFKNKCRGCRARALGVTGDYLAGDPTCALAKEAVLV